MTCIADRWCRIRTWARVLVVLVTLAASVLVMPPPGATASADPASTPIDFSNWTAQGGSSKWTTSAGGSAVTELNNGDETYFVSPDDDLVDYDVQGTIVAPANWDNDYFGLASGYQAPLAARGVAQLIGLMGLANAAEASLDRALASKAHAVVAAASFVIGVYGSLNPESSVSAGMGIVFRVMSFGTSTSSGMPSLSTVLENTIGLSTALSAIRSATDGSPPPADTSRSRSLSRGILGAAFGASELYQAAQCL